MSFDLTTELAVFLEEVLRGSTSGDVLTANGFDVVPTWQAASGGGVPIYQQSTQFSDSQIRAFPTTRRTIINAAGNNTLVVPVSVVYDADFTAGAYVASADASWQLFLGTQDDGDQYITAAIQGGDVVLTAAQRSLGAFLLGKALDGVGTFTGTLQSVRWGQATFGLNKPIQIGDWYGGVSDYTSGHANNTVNICATYHIYNAATRAFV